MRKVFVLILSTLAMLAALSASLQVWAASIEIGQEAVDEVFVEKELESSLTRDIRAYLGNDRFIVGVDLKLSGKRGPGGEDQVTVREITTTLPGLPKASETFTKELTPEELQNLNENLLIEGAPNKPTNPLTGTGTEIYLVLDTTVTSVQETFIRDLIARKLSLDVAGGDSIQVVRSTFAVNAPSNNTATPAPAPVPNRAMPFPQSNYGGFPVQPQQAPVVNDAANQSAVTEGNLQEQLTAEEIMAMIESSKEATSKGFFEDNLGLALGGGALLLLLLILLLFLALRRSPSYAPQPQYYPQPAPAAPVAASAESSTQEADSAKESRNAVGEIRREIASIGLSSPDTSRAEMDGLWAQGRMDIIAPVYKVLGEDVFESLFGEMSGSKKAEVGEYLSEREISDTQIEAHAKDFYGKLVRGASNNSEASRAQTFKFLDKLHLSQILFLIKGEKPRIQALIISQLKSQQASSILQSIDAKQRSEIIHELAQFETFPVETFRDVATLLANKARKIPAVENVQTDGIGILMNLLDSMNNVEEEKILSDLSLKDPELHQKLRAQYFTFADLAKAPQKIMGESLLDMDKSSLASALTGANENVIRRVLGSLPKRLADSVKEEIGLLKGKLSPEQIQAGRKVIIGRMRDLVREGKIDMSKL